MYFTNEEPLSPATCGYNRWDVCIRSLVLEKQLTLSAGCIFGVVPGDILWSETCTVLAEEWWQARMPHVVRESAIPLQLQYFRAHEVEGHGVHEAGGIFVLQRLVSKGTKVTGSNGVHSGLFSFMISMKTRRQQPRFLCSCTFCSVNYKL